MSLATPSAKNAGISLENHDDDIGQMFGDDYETNRRYLTFSWWLLHRGWRDLMEKVRAAVIEVFGPLNPREDITLARLSELTLQVRKKVEGATEEERRYRDFPVSSLPNLMLTARRSMNWLPYLLPPREQEDMVLKESGVLGSSTETSPQTAATLRHLLDETSDLIESPYFTHILTLLNNEAFSILVDHNCAIEAFKQSPPTSQPAGAATQQSFSSSATIIPSASPAAPKAKLATVLAVMTRQSHVIGNGTNPPNQYLVAMEQGVRELEAFAAVVYSSNLQSELPHFAEDYSVPATTQPTGQNTASHSPALVAVDRRGDSGFGKDAEASVVDLGQSVMQRAESSSTAAASWATAEDPAFEKAWGKAVEENS